mgnify:CR=1 FL=1
MMPPSSMMRWETILLVGPLCLWKAGPTLNQSPSNLPVLLLSFHISIPFSIALLPGGDLLAVRPILIQIHAIPLPESDGSDESAFESHPIDARYAVWFCRNTSKTRAPALLSTISQKWRRTMYANPASPGISQEMLKEVSELAWRRRLELESCWMPVLYTACGAM